MTILLLDTYQCACNWLRNQSANWTRNTKSDPVPQDTSITKSCYTASQIWVSLYSQPRDVSCQKSHSRSPYRKSMLLTSSVHIRPRMNDLSPVSPSWHKTVSRWVHAPLRTSIHWKNLQLLESSHWLSRFSPWLNFSLLIYKNYNSNLRLQLKAPWGFGVLGFWGFGGTHFRTCSL